MAQARVRAHRYRCAMRPSRRLPRAAAAILATGLTGSLLALVAPPASAADLQGRGWYGLPTTMTLTTPQVYVGVPVTFTAILSNTVVSGTVTFWVNDPVYGLAPSVPVVNGKATLTWLPGYTWIKNWQVYGASFSPNPQQGTTSAEATTPPMSVLPNLGADAITVSPAGLALTAGRSSAFTATTTSGSAVAMSVTGPCSLTGVGTNAATITASSAGTCALTMASNGGNGYLSASTTTPIPVTAPAPPKPKKPAKKK